MEQNTHRPNKINFPRFVADHLAINDQSWIDQLRLAARGDGTYDPLVIERILDRAHARLEILRSGFVGHTDDPLEQAMRETAIERGQSMEQPSGEGGSK